ncbi:hypothetical protein JW921_00825 [Candidatus Fermentibacterales bacterium]|nr:hypothetical protein [Candidatus Fermentibacterales bacterium]
MPTTRIIYDMHVHTSNSPDADFPESLLASRAADAGLSGVGFVAHVDYHPRDFCYAWFDAARYDEAFAKAVESRGSDGPVLLKGIEIGEPHRFGERAMEAASGYDYDFVVGALHWVGEELVLEKEPFEARADPMGLVEEYLRQSIEMVETGGFDVLAHLGIFRRGMTQAGLDLRELDETRLFPDLVRQLLSSMVERGVALELNTSGLRRDERVTYPVPPVLALYRSLGGTRVTLGSDTHRDPWVFYGLGEGVDMLLEAGFGTALLYRRGEPVEYPLR